MICACERDENGKVIVACGEVHEVRTVPGAAWSVVSYGDYVCREQELCCALELLQRVLPLVADDDLREEVETVIRALGNA